MGSDSELIFIVFCFFALRAIVEEQIQLMNDYCR